VGGATARFTALVLAGRRGASDEFADALAASDASGHRALLDVAGVPMLVRVLRALLASPSVGAVVVSIDDLEVLARVPELRDILAAGRVTVRQALDSPSRSVADVLELDPSEPMLVVTADHALLTPEMIEHFTRNATGDADVWVAVVTAAVIRARYPETRRTYLALRDTSVSGGNLFAFLTPRARRAAEFWVRAERYRKQPWRLAAAFGPLSLLLFALRRLSLDAALARMSRAMGARVGAVRMPWAEAAIDVDRPADLALVNRILGERATTAAPLP
jgi:GTP:adenosylcobinamide-phosphate guanylyltransferase